MNSFWKILSDIIFRPHHFFRKISHHGIKQPFKFFLIFSLITQLLLVYHFLRSKVVIPLHDLGMGPNFTPEFTVTTFVVVYIVAIIWTIFFGFLWPLIAHLFVKLFNKGAKYKETYKCLIYGGAPSYVAVPFYIILLATGFSLFYTRSPVIIAIFFLSLIIQLIAHIYTIYLKLMSISRIQHISMIKGFLAVYIFPTTMLVIAEIIVITIIVLLHLM